MGAAIPPQPLLWEDASMGSFLPSSVISADVKASSFSAGKDGCQIGVHFHINAHEYISNVQWVEEMKSASSLYLLQF